MIMRTDISRLRSARGRRGFTLVEAVVAILVIGIMVLTLYSAMTTGFFSIRLARENLRATQVILEKMEVIRLLTWDQLNAGILPSTFTASYNPADPQEKTIYNGTISVTSINPATRNYHPDMRRITVTIKWDSAGLPRQRELSTYMARAGIQNYVINGTQ
jgi:prepilin-type N-terminal cleavage/methylation domain-containing protein